MKKTLFILIISCLIAPISHAENKCRQHELLGKINGGNLACYSCDTKEDIEVDDDVVSRYFLNEICPNRYEFYNRKTGKHISTIECPEGTTTDCEKMFNDNDKNSCEYDRRARHTCYESIGCESNEIIGRSLSDDENHCFPCDYGVTISLEHMTPEQAIAICPNRVIEEHKNNEGTFYTSLLHCSDSRTNDCENVYFSEDKKECLKHNGRYCYYTNSCQENEMPGGVRNKEGFCHSCNSQDAIKLLNITPEEAIQLCPNRYIYGDWHWKGSYLTCPEHTTNICDEAYYAKDKEKCRKNNGKYYCYRKTKIPRGYR